MTRIGYVSTLRKHCFFIVVVLSVFTIFAFSPHVSADDNTPPVAYDMHYDKDLGEGCIRARSR